MPLDDRQRHHLDELVRQYAHRTRASQQRREQAWPALADPRASQGLFDELPPAAREAWLATKALRHPLVAERAEGARVWDIDGNEHIDFCMGFGVHLFGHRPAFLDQALRSALDRGLPIGYQSERANAVATAIAAMTGAERVAFCNTGAEASMGALRLARAASGRDGIAVFAGSYHGSYDAVLPATGMHRGLSERQRADTLVLAYGDPQSLERIAEHASTLAAVFVEPVQARNLRLQPAQFLHELRALTRERGIALVFDDVLLGFRVHQGGSQAWFGVQADLTTYGKILGGGLPIGVVTGAARYLDAIDGGRWSAHDDSRPAGNKVWLAGTFTKNPLTMAAADAVTRQLEAAGPALQAGLNATTARLVERLKAWLSEHAMPVQVEHFGSLFRFAMAPSLWILLAHLRMRGIYAFDGMTFFVSTAHVEPDLERLESAVHEGLLAMRDGGFIP
jgi:glutamate-1-semialdehyde aminotransferase